MDRRRNMTIVAMPDRKRTLVAFDRRRNMTLAAYNRDTDFDLPRDSHTDLILPAIVQKTTRTVAVLKKRAVPLPPIGRASDKGEAKKNILMQMTSLVKTSSSDSDLSYQVFKPQGSLLIDPKNIPDSMICPDTLSLRDISDFKAPPMEILKRKKTVEPHYKLMLKKSLKDEQRRLQNFKKFKAAQLEMEDYIMKKTGKERHKLLVRRKQLLVKSHPQGEERNVIELERTYTPEVFPDSAFFECSKYLKYQKDGITVSLTRRERGYDVKPEWVGCPDVTEIAKSKGKTESKDTVQLKRSHVQTAVGPVVLNDAGQFVPEVPVLGIVGTTVKSFFKNKYGQMYNYDEMSRGRDYDIDRLTPLSPWAGRSRSFKMSNQSLETDSSDDDDQRSSRVALQFGETVLAWSKDKNRRNQSIMVEVGCSAEFGMKAVGSISMTNIGTTAIYFNWFREERKESFNMEKDHEVGRFIFDCWGGVILPDEKFRIPFMYKAFNKGFYYEDWRLVTNPVLENGGKIILRLSGYTRHYDPYVLAKIKIEEAVKVREAPTIVKQIVDNLIQHLPLKEGPLKDTRFLLCYKGKDLFHLLNPGLHYNTAAVYRLSKILEIVQSMDGKGDNVSDYGMSSDYFESDYESLHDTGSVAESDFKPEQAEDSISYKERSSGRNSQSDSSPGGSHLWRRSLPSETPLLLLYKKIDPDQKSLKVLPLESPPHSPEDISVTGTTVSEKPDKKASIIPRKESSSISSGVDQRRASMHASKFLDVPETEEKPQPKIHRKVFARAPMNLVNTDFTVDALREEILIGIISTTEQDLIFNALSNEVSSLMFRKDEPISINWKLMVSRTLMCTLLDSFSDFDVKLQEQCCLGETHADAFPDNLTHKKSMAIISDSNVIWTVAQFGAKLYRKSKEKSDNRQNWRVLTSQCQEGSPRTTLGYTRFQKMYYSRLYTKMYSLLVDYFDTLETLFTEKKQAHIDYRELTFRRVDDVPMTLRAEDLLEIPTAPFWIKVASRLGNVQSSIAARLKKFE